MKPPEFFRDLSERFLELAKSERDFQASCSQESHRFLAQEIDWLAVTQAKRGGGSPERAAELAREAAHKAMLPDSEWWEYRLSNGPKNETERYSLEKKWIALATIAACAADLVIESRDPRDCWLDKLREQGSYFTRCSGSTEDKDGEIVEFNGGVIRPLCKASSDCCVQLEAESFSIANRKDQRTSSPVVDLNLDTPDGRRALVDAYLEAKFRATGQRQTRKDLWKSAGYEDATEFERWQRCDSRSTEGANHRFMKILTS